jgi:predicted DCC family thiol-disulfide oxidoreductase YuxK
MRADINRDDNWLLYDGECPFCSRYVQRIKLLEAIGPIRLIDARDNTAEAHTVRKAGLEIDDGMVLNFNGQLYHGDDCLHRLALLSTSIGLFNRINASMFRSQTMSRLCYPILRACRNLTLRILRRHRIADGQQVKREQG